MSTQQAERVDAARDPSVRWDQPSARVSPALDRLVEELREVIRRPGPWPEIAQRVADHLHDHLPEAADLLTEQERLGKPDPLKSQLLHAEPDGTLSVVGLVARPGQATPIHDHVTWCATAVIQGVEHEELFALDEDEQALTVIGTTENPRGAVSGFAPPGDIHRVRTSGDEIAISIHVYGTDISRVGSSVRREYDLPVR